MNKKRMVRLFRRVKDWDGGFILGTRVVKQWGEYLFDYKGLKIFGYYEPDGRYIISEGISGYFIYENEDREKAIKESSKRLEMADSAYINKIKAMAPYYGMSAMHTSAMHTSAMYIVRDNTLLGSTKRKKVYQNRTGNIRCKDCDVLYERCKNSNKSCCPDCNCRTRSKKMSKD